MSKKNRKSNKKEEPVIVSLTKRMLCRTTHRFFEYVVGPLMRWAIDDDEKKSFFFLIIGNDAAVDVAFANAENLMVDGGLAVATDPKAAAMWEGIDTTYRVQLEDERKNPQFEKDFQDFDYYDKENDNHWVSTDLE